MKPLITGKIRRMTLSPGNLFGLSVLHRLRDATLHYPFGISAVQPYLLAFGVSLIQVGFFILLNAGARPPHSSS